MTARIGPDTFQQIEVKSRSEWRAWLKAHHKQQASIWAVTYKKAAGSRHVPYEAIVEEALCFGWVDSLPRKLDEERTMLLVSPRKARSAWSAANKARAERMIEAGKMTPAGLAKIEQAKADGKWDFLEDVEAGAVPADLAAALAKHGKARAHFEAFPASARRGILEWIKQAKRPETRLKRIEETARLAAQNIRANEWRKP